MRGIGQGAPPALRVEMLGIFVALPIGLAAESLVALGEGASIWPFVAFLMLPFKTTQSAKSRLILKETPRLTYFISHRRRVRFVQKSH